ncbi:unnamed protein product [Cuscuta campestris]|uniref:Uncharacterized protein n=1 Tax=Cuscuta campestris TaxID=132261 RepID=A0A484JYG4_9ASTE|nr:unnamed protein product [Cuscuta campestris]
MASPQPWSHRLALTPGTPVTPAPGSSAGARALTTPLTDELIWKKLREAGLDEESIKRRDKAALIAYIAKLESQLYDHQHHMGLLLMEQKMWESKYSELVATADSAQLLYKREQAARMKDVAEAKKREDNLNKALGIEKECVANIEKALHEMRTEYAEAKVAAEAKLTEARSLMEDAQKKYTEAELKLHTAESLETEARRFRCTAERKLREVEDREDDLRRQILSFKSDCDAKEHEIDLERQSLLERHKALQQTQQSVLDGQALLNQREEHILNRSQDLSKYEKELEDAKSNLENDRKTLNEERHNLELKAASLSNREEEAVKREVDLKHKEESLLLLQRKIESREFDGVKKVIANKEAALVTKKYAVEAELEMKRKKVEEELEAMKRAWELKEMDIKQREDLIADKEHDIDMQLRRLAEKEREMDERMQFLDEKEKNLTDYERSIESAMSRMQHDKKEIERIKSDLQRSLDELEQKKEYIYHEEEKVETMKSETKELMSLEMRLKEEIDAIRAQKSKLEDMEEQLKAEKAKFEAEWECIDEKRAELQKEEEHIAAERLAISMLLKEERDALKAEKSAIQEQYKHDLEALSHDREVFNREVEHEREEWFGKIQKERTSFLLEFEMRKKELENCVEKRREEIESDFKGREKAFEEEKKRELESIASLRETALKEMEYAQQEMERLGAERKEIIAAREERNKEWVELDNSIKQLEVQRLKLEKQRELLHADREDILSQIDYLKKLEEIKVIPDRIRIPVKQHQAHVKSDERNHSRKKILQQQSEYNTSRHISNGELENPSSSPISTPLSWLKRCANTLLDRGQSNKRRREDNGFESPPQDITMPCLPGTESDEPAHEDPDIEFERIPVCTEDETTVFIDKMVTVREVTTVDIKPVASNTQPLLPKNSDKYGESNDDNAHSDVNGKLEEDDSTIARKSSY